MEDITHGRSIYLVSQAKLFLICTLSEGVRRVGGASLELDCSSYCVVVCVCVLDATGDKELLQNIPEIRDKFNILSKIGEGQFKDVALCSVKEEECTVTPPT